MCFPPTVSLERSLRSPLPSLPFWSPLCKGPGLAQTPLEGLGHSRNAWSSPLRALGMGEWGNNASPQGVYAWVKKYNQGDQPGEREGLGQD